MEIKNKELMFLALVKTLSSLGWRIDYIKGLGLTSAEEFYAKAYPPKEGSQFINMRINKKSKFFLFTYNTSFPDIVINNVDIFKEVIHKVFFPDIVKSISPLNVLFVNAFPIIGIKKHIFIESYGEQYAIDVLNDFMNAMDIIETEYDKFEIDCSYLFDKCRSL